MLIRNAVAQALADGPAPTTDIELMDVGATAAELGIGTRQVRHAVEKGVIPHVRIGSRVFFRRSTLAAWMAAQERAAAPPGDQVASEEAATSPETDAENPSNR
ncbi:MAG: helix-turn-helix domain-containing protein [Magnetospiraceae bacterium]